jgi:hypothetical protein
MDPAPAITVGPSPVKVLGATVLASIVGTVGGAILLMFLGYVAEPWLLSSIWFILAWTVAILACWCGLAAVGTILWRRPRVEIGPDGFVTQGILGRRPRRWSDIEGDFTVIRMGLGSVVAYHLTDAFKHATRIQPIAGLAGNDEAITFCGELTLGAGELAELLNRWKQDAPSTTPSA